MTLRQKIKCAICGRDCIKNKYGWYCMACDEYTETDVEVED